ncbi:MAG: small acid-soluble spore protein Tlp [Syntrophomonadaceae bacterium]
MKNKPDDRSDNVEKIQKHIDDTLQNIDAAEEMIALSDNPKTRRDLKAKNRRREEALDSMRAEIRDEARDRDSE